MSLPEILESYSHIELTDDEMSEAIIWRKQRKEAELQKVQREDEINERRKNLSGSAWSYEQTRDYILWRANNLFNGKFNLDEDNRMVFELLCYYFSGDERFVSLANDFGIDNPSLSKGLMFAGNFGVGKTWMMKLFSKNQRQCFRIVNCKVVADTFQTKGEDEMDEYIKNEKNAINDADRFYQPALGMCFDDLGTEEVKSHYGNKKNVIGDLIEKRYAAGTTGTVFHSSTNLTALQLNDFYGGRVVSRMREIFNFIEFKGNDRRK